MYELFYFIEVLLTEVVVFQLAGVARHDGDTRFHPIVIAVLELPVEDPHTLQKDLLLPIRLNHVNHLLEDVKQAELIRSTLVDPSFDLAVLLHLASNIRQWFTVQGKEIDAFFVRRVLKDWRRRIPC